MGRLRSAFGRARGRLAALSPAWKVTLGAFALALVAGSGALLYRTYDYVQHDNDFCLSCHLMRDPYERFAQSAHRGLGCKACHQPTFAARSKMALTQILQNPDSLGTHAEVPNERCVECHVDGDPEKWQLIRTSAGHRVHLESDDPSLRGLTCVECHSTSVHEFAPSDRTCGQAECHEDTKVRLGKMAKLTIHCAACHDFNRPLPDSVARDTAAPPALLPRREECLSCHAMRVLTADMPEDEPHEGACGACHNPHEQATPAEAVKSCAEAGCHTRPDTLSPMHRGLEAGVLEDCTACHGAHTFKVEGERCLDCHQDIFRDEPAPAAPPRAAPAPARPTARAPAATSGSAGAWMRFAVHTAGSGEARATFAQQQPPQEPRRLANLPLGFTHRRHQQVRCTECHTSERVHGALKITSARECQQCHHTAPVGNTCANCHQGNELGASYPVRQTLRLSTGAEARALPFSHPQHRGQQCLACHREPVTLKANVPCAQCHQQHHAVGGTACLACHARPAASAHQVEAHLGCTGSGCHSQASWPLRGVQRTRSVCLACHQDLTRHEPGRECINCHRLPRPTQRAALPAGAPPGGQP